MTRATEMGRVVVSAKIENLGDLLLVKSGDLDPAKMRQLEVSDALVDTGASNLAMPKSMIEQLGLTPMRERPMRTAAGIRNFKIYGAVRLTIDERDCTIDVSELEEGCPVLIGQVPLELMDWVVDPKNQRLIGNPDHDGKWVLDMF